MAMQFDPSDRCLHICMLGDAGIGHSSFLKCYGAQAQAGENAEDSVTRESNGKQWKTMENMLHSKHSNKVNTFLALYFEGLT